MSHSSLAVSTESCPPIAYPSLAFMACGCMLISLAVHQEPDIMQGCSTLGRVYRRPTPQQCTSPLRKEMRRACCLASCCMHVISCSRSALWEPASQPSVMSSSSSACPNLHEPDQGFRGRAGGWRLGVGVPVRPATRRSTQRCASAVFLAGHAAWDWLGTGSGGGCCRPELSLRLAMAGSAL